MPTEMCVWYDTISYIFAKVIQQREKRKTKQLKRKKMKLGAESEESWSKIQWSLFYPHSSKA